MEGKDRPIAPGFKPYVRKPNVYQCSHKGGGHFGMLEDYY